MFGNSGLSLEQAPPINVVLRLLLIATFFGIIVGVEIFLFNNHLLNSNSSEALIVVHTLTLGVMASFMIGALFQMLPVLSGVFVKSAELLSIRVSYTLLFGTIFLLSYFGNGSGIALSFAIIFLSYSLFMTSITIFNKLKTVKHSATSRGMLLAISSLFIVAFIGIILLLIRWGFGIDIDYQALKFAHFSFGLFGWIALLVVSVSFQVIEMFYVTTEFNTIYSKYMPIAIFVLLWVNIALAFFGLEFQYFVFTLIDLLLLLHLIQIAWKLKKRKRKVKDGTVWLWYLASGSFVGFSLLVIEANFIEINPFFIATLFAFFATSIAIAMSYKIVPFLVWFHLNSKGYFEAPMMHEIVHPKYIRVTFWLYFASFLSFFASFLLPFFLYIGAILFIFTFLLLFISIYNAINRYNYILKYGKRIDFNF